MTTKIPQDRTRAPGDRTRALLDSNIWRYVIDNGSQGRLLRLARDSRYLVQIAPSVLYEALRLKDVSKRTPLVRLMTNSRFHRLMPEAYSESMEVLREIERVRPQWLRDTPDLRFFNRLKKDWSRRTGGFWVRSANSPRSEAHYVAELEGTMMEEARVEAEVGRKEIMESPWRRIPRLDEMVIRFEYQLPGWRGDPVEAWRVDGMDGISHGLAQRDHGYRDWMEPFIELDSGVLRSAAWVEFWLYLSDKSALPRLWMRWAHRFVQRFRTVTPGSAADAQLFTYFIDTDVVITADRALLQILDECRPYAPCQLPEGKIVPAGPPGVADLFRILDA